MSLFLASSPAESIYLQMGTYILAQNQDTKSLQAVLPVCWSLHPYILQTTKPWPSPPIIPWCEPPYVSELVIDDYLENTPEPYDSTLGTSSAILAFGNYLSGYNPSSFILNSPSALPFDEEQLLLRNLEDGATDKAADLFTWREIRMTFRA
ncbi:hypothetical protein BDQ17DRAFT_1545469 [Cyathus striatus]|nr:hypothetical protein BDQ17DRAFT_1545469 [Cyathus striatus]